MPPMPSQQMSPAQLNANQRAIVLRAAMPMTQQVYTNTVYPASSPLLNIPPRNVGLIKRFTVEIAGVINNSGTVPINLTDFALANILSNVTFTDLNNNVRINTSGIHLSLIATGKRRRPYAVTYDANTSTGNNLSQVFNVPPASWPVLQAPQTIAAGANGSFRVMYEVPLAYSDSDLRGAVYANVINATQNLALTLNQNIVSAGAGDDTYAVYKGAAGAAGSITTATVNVYQEYLDQLPVNQGNVILPVLDLSTIYELKNTNFTAVSAGQDFPIAYSNFRDFVSTFTIFNSTGAAGGRNFGTDVNYWSLQAANFTNIFKVDPLLATARAREHIMSDLPAGCYYFPSRDKAISTTQYGNMELILNAIAAGPSSYVQTMWESTALQNTLASAGSLAAAG